MIEYINKDVTTVTTGIVAHGVNCQHAMNSGVAKAIRNRWPIVYEMYRSRPRGKAMLGIIDMISVDPSDMLWVANCYTQVFYGRGGKFADPDAIRSCLSGVAIYAKIYELPVYMPRIGCGLGGLDWKKDVSPIVQRVNSEHNDMINIFVCDYED